MTGAVALYASEPQYLAHVLPVWQALPVERRGLAHAPRGVAQLHPQFDLVGGIPSGGLTLVSSWQDLNAVRRRGGRAIFVEHGAGQTYDGDPMGRAHRSYSGGEAREGVALFIVPGERVAERCRATQPETPVAVVGCPFLDPWHSRKRPTGPEPGEPPVVAVTFHADIALCPETRWAVPWLLPELERLAADPPWRLIGHAHPRAWAQLERTYDRLGIEPVESWAEVLDRASVLVGDNTSALPEFASTGRPVVFVSPPWYRREVEHGGRFWRWPGAQGHVVEPADLAPEVDRSLRDAERIRAARRRMVADVYAYTDGRATERAVQAIMEL